MVNQWNVPNATAEWSGRFCVVTLNRLCILCLRRQTSRNQRPGSQYNSDQRNEPKFAWSMDHNENRPVSLINATEYHATMIGHAMDYKISQMLLCIPLTWEGNSASQRISDDMKYERFVAANASVLRGVRHDRKTCKMVASV